MFVKMKNVTVAMDDQLSHWVRVRAAEQRMSVSRFLAHLLRRHMAEDHSYEAAKRRSLSLAPVQLKGESTYPTREEIHDRPLLRR